MPILHAHDRPAIGGTSPDLALTDRPIARFGLHFLQMCAVMCLGAITLNLVVFGPATLLGYSNMTSRLPESVRFMINPVAAGRIFVGHHSECCAVDGGAAFPVTMPLASVM
jgi:hypothetical protein